MTGLTFENNRNFQETNFYTFAADDSKTGENKKEILNKGGDLK